MKTMPILIAMLLAGSAFAMPDDCPIAQDLQRRFDQTKAETAAIPFAGVKQPSSTPSITTIGPCGAGYQIISDYPDGHSTVSQAGPCGAGWIIVNQP